MLKHKIVPILLGLMLIALAIFCQNSSYQLIKDIHGHLDQIFYDSTLQLNSLNKQKKSSVPIVIIDIDDKSIIEEGRWPWPRNKMADLLKKIQEAGALVVAFDITFSQPEINELESVTKKWQAKYPSTNKEILQQFKNLAPEFDYSTMFADRLAQGTNVLGFVLHNNVDIPSLGTLPPPVLTGDTPLPNIKNYRGNLEQLQKASKNGGFVTVWPDSDGSLRHFFLLLAHENKVYPSLALEATRQYLLIDKINIKTVKLDQKEIIEAIEFGEKQIPTSANGEVLIPYGGIPPQFPYLSATEVLNAPPKKNILNNAIVFIGSTSAILHDLHPSPIDPMFPGVEIHALITKALIEGGFSHLPDWGRGAENFAILFFGLICAFLFPFLGALSVISITIGLVIALCLGYAWLLHTYFLVITFSFSILCIISIAILNLFYGFFSEHKLRKELKDVFGQYLPASRVDLMSQNPKKYTYEGESKELTVLFADIRNFTGISESLTATEVRNLLNRYFTSMTEIIFKHKGTIDKYVGDMIMAFWGAPLDNKAHVKDALDSALEMIETTEKLKAEFSQAGLPEVNIGIGINTGNMFVGDMGSQFRRSYTVLGDSVNLGSRLQDLSKFYGVKIVVGGNQDQKDFVFRQLDKARVKGKTKPVDIFELVCRRTDATEILLQELSLYDKALKYYYAQQWDNAEATFNQLIKNYSNHPLYFLYLQRIQELRLKPADPSWDGAYEHKHK